MPNLEPQPDLTQRQFLKKLVGTAAGVAGLAATGQMLNPTPAEAAYNPGAAPDGGDLVTTSLWVQGNVTTQGPRPWIDVIAYGAKGDGIANDTVAIQNAFNAIPALGGTVFFPPGRYKLTGQILCSNRHVHVVGAGRGVTRLQWEAWGGFHFAFNDWRHRLTVQSLSLTTTTADGGAAIAAEWQGWGGGPTSSPHIFDVHIGPGDNGVGYWTKGIVMTNGCGVRIEHFDIHGLSGFGMSRGIHLLGNSTISNIHAGFITIVDRGIEVSGESEGLYISDVEVVGANVGYWVDSEGPGSAISNCHAATFLCGILLHLHGDIALTGNLLYRDNGSGSYIGISVAHSHFCRIIGNAVLTLGPSPKEGIVLGGVSADCTIQGNVIAGMDRGIVLDGGGTDGNIVSGNRIVGSPPGFAIVNSGVNNLIVNNLV